MAAKINPIKVKQEADKLEKAGKLEQAITFYRQIVDDNPRDWNTINKIGDLFAKLNKNREAGLEYAKVADFYAKDGFLLKAIAIWKKINKLDGSALEPYQNLADLYAKQGLMMEAKGQYQIVVDEYVKRGKLRDAGEVLRKIAEIDPSDLKIRSRLADLYTREGNAPKAVEEHIAIAEELNKKGHLAEALQVLEKGLKIDPTNSRLRAELARIHLLQKNFEKAARYLEEAVQQAPTDTDLLARLGQAYLGSKKMEEAEAIFRRLIELNPNDEESRLQMGRVFLLQGHYDHAFDVFQPIINQRIERREANRACELLIEITQQQPTHIRSLIRLSEIYRLLGQDSYVVSTYSQLTEAYLKDGHLDQAVSILEALIAMEPQTQQHRNKLQFVRDKQKAAQARPVPAAPPAAAHGAPPQALEIEDEEFDLSMPDSAPLSFDSAPGAPMRARPGQPAPQPAAAAMPTIEASGPLSDEDKEFIDEHLAEGRVFRKYGLIDKAADQFEAIVARFPDNVEARQELREIYTEKGQMAQAHEHSMALAQIFQQRGEPDKAQSFAGSAPAPARAAAPAAPSFVPPPPPPRPQPAPPPPPAPFAAEEEISLEVEEEAFPAPMDLRQPAPRQEMESFDLEGEIGGPGEISPQFIDEEPPPPPRTPAADQGFDLESVIDIETPAAEEEEISLSLDGPPAVEMPPEQRAEPSFVEEELPLSMEPAAEEELSLDSLVSAPSFAPPPPPPPPPPAPVRAAAPPLRAPEPPPVPVKPSLPADLQKLLDDIDTYVSLGFIENAKDILRTVGNRYPGHPAILEKIEALGLDQEIVEESPLGALAEPDLGEPAPVDESPLGDLDLSIEEPAAPVSKGLSVDLHTGDLGSELDSLFGSQEAVAELPVTEVGTDLGDSGLAEIFKEFKKGVDKQLSKEDYDTRYNLGIAYKEMGLVDEAIAEFQLAAKDETRMLECSSMLGLCFMEKGMPKLAVKWFEKGLDAPGRTDEEYQGLRYDLAQAYEAAGDLDRALGMYSELYGQDANYRDVASKVHEIQALAH
ncbi:MAG: tetratricopeptide repeat protein [Vicinamibacteria bacterium]|nr:tetratricopeptide repeat protein [Vicinamibacteria bacterium]